MEPRSANRIFGQYSRTLQLDKSRRRAGVSFCVSQRGDWGCCSTRCFERVQFVVCQRICRSNAIVILSHPAQTSASPSSSSHLFTQRPLVTSQVQHDLFVRGAELETQSVGLTRREGMHSTSCADSSLELSASSRSSSSRAAVTAEAAIAVTAIIDTAAVTTVTKVTEATAPGVEAPSAGRLAGRSAADVAGCSARSSSGWTRRPAKRR